MLGFLTLVVNLIALAASVWLGFYLVTRSPRTAVSWLAALALWVLAGYFMQNAVAVPGLGEQDLDWLRPFIIMILPFWLHLTVLLLPPAQRPAWLVYAGVPFAYLLSSVLVALGLFTDLLFVHTTVDEPLYISVRPAGPVYVLILPSLVVGFGVSLWNLWRARALNRDRNLSGQFDALIVATALVTLASAYIALGTLASLRLPFVLADAGLGIGVFVFGYAVARYRAALEGRPMDRDFLYTFLVVGSLTAFYVLVVFILFMNGVVSFLTLALTMVGTIAANSLFDGVRITLDRLFYRGQFQSLRANLRALAQEAGTSERLPEQMQKLLGALCRALRLRSGLVAVGEGDHWRVSASQNAIAVGTELPAALLAAEESVGLLRSERKGLAGMQVLVPLEADGRQVGALVLGSKETGEPYDDRDLELLEDLADQMAVIIHGEQSQDASAQQINALVADFRERERALQLQVQQMLAERQSAPPATPSAAPVDEEQLVPLVEDGLRHLHDFPYLGEHALGKLRAVEERFAGRGDGATFIERGKAVSELLTQSVNALRPAGAEPKGNQIPPREWHLFVILNDSYVRQEPNRNIMSRLYISEGTFNRTRRRALRALAKTLAEMEARMGKGDGVTR